jgi:class 3 adenylate cyclase/tetratricopeptide (TPR) repeat protein
VEGPAQSCANCGGLNDAAARFCSTCGNRLAGPEATQPAAQTASQPAQRELERKVITALFCDLVGSTELAERLDAEDVEQLLSTYHGRARRVIEAHGGVVEKFIGDAVVGIFGAPAVHEDDPARAIRAALAVARDIAESGLGLHIRIGISTGEAIVRVDADRSPEEAFATGGSMNAAARVQNAAPIDGIAVADATYHLAAAEFRWEDLGAVTLKGIAEPVRIWRPLAARSAAARSEDEESTPLVGRDAELATLTRAFDAAAASSRLQVVTIVAEAGLGKSRLVRELRRSAEASRSGTVWRVGRSLPYGEGLSFWALGEIVKSHAGILETDDQATIGAKLDAVIQEADPSRRAWMRERLAPLVGLRTDTIPPAQEEAFAAWRSFLESLAAHGPAVIVIEDLHWADAALVRFLAELAEHPAELPILLVVTARPEVAERHPVWLVERLGSRVVTLVSLDDEAIERLIGSTLGDASPELRQTVLERAAGSPLYAEQLAALIRERGGTDPDAPLDERTIPPTVQTLLAARIDALPRELKPAILDASVIGRVFWSGAVASLEDRDPATIEFALTDLERRELTRSHRPSTMVDEQEYGFWHALLREVAYAFLPRSARLAKHRAAAAWITDKAGGALGDLAEIVVDHLRRAAELAEATGAQDQLPDIRARLITAMLAAAHHLLRVDAARAVEEFRRVLERMPDDDPRRGETLASLGRALLARSEYPEAAELLDTAHAWHLARGEDLAAAELAVARHTALQGKGDNEAAIAVDASARPILEATPGLGLVEFLAAQADYEAGAEPKIRISRAEQAIATAERLGVAVPPMALLARGFAKLELHDPTGEADARRGIELAAAAGDSRRVLTGLVNLAWGLMDFSDTLTALGAYDEALAFAKDHGLADMDVRANRLDVLFTGGRYDETLAEAAVIRAWAVARGDAYATLMSDMQRAGVQAARGEPIEDAAAIANLMRTFGWPPTPPAGIEATVAIARGDPEAARQIIGESIDGTPAGAYTYGTLDLVRMALQLDDIALARKVLTRAAPPGPSARGHLTLLATAEIAKADGDLQTAHAAYAEAIEFFTDHAWPWEQAIALAGLGRCLVGLGDRDAGLAAMGQARELAEGLGAAPFIAELDTWLAAAR